MKIYKIAMPGRVVELEHPIEVTISDQYGIDMHLVHGILRGFFDYKAIGVKYDTTYSDGKTEQTVTACLKAEEGANMVKIIPTKLEAYATDVKLIVTEVYEDETNDEV